MTIGILLLFVVAACGSEPKKPGSTPNDGRAQPGGSGAVLVPVDGGPDYYAKFSPGLPTDPGFFPIAVWYESVASADDVRVDKEAGLNSYVELTADSNFQAIADGKMYAIPSEAGDDHGKETVGWLLADEVDMWAGGGNGKWTGNFPGEGDICVSGQTDCGYSLLNKQRAELPKDKRLRFANYGKGVLFWLDEGEAEHFVNTFSDVVSTDIYWFTDQNVCGHGEGGTIFEGQDLDKATCRRAANYGFVVEKVRSMIKPANSKPVWGFVEVGQPSEGAPMIKPEQITAAVWSMIINGARGIMYFNHSFYGDCRSQHALREPCYAANRAAVTAVNKRIAALAPVLNAPFADGVLNAPNGVDASVKWHDGHFYILAGSAEAAGGKATLSLPCVGNATVTVLDENRTLQMITGMFTDDFADGNAVHIYRVDGGSSCGLT
ncbi:hypothetical protein [Luedemannella flava]|uniref:hypothetical protein n=1 Tax=Luedemannella flava TaxID=349316 RepID=UPI0031D6243B